MIKEPKLEVISKLTSSVDKGAAMEDGRETGKAGVTSDEVEEAESST